MNNRIDALVRCLQVKESLLEKLVLLLDEERGHIVDLDMQGLEAKRLSKLEIMGQLEQCKSSCRKALDEAGLAVKVDSPVKLSAVIAVAPSSRREVLLNVQRRLFELTDLLNRSNRFNRDLLYGSLSTVNRSLEFINKRLGRGVSTYSNAGSVVSGASGSKLVNGAI